MMVENEIQPILEQLLAVTQELRNQVVDDNDNIEGWSQLIDEREEMIKQISALQSQGCILSADQKLHYLQKMYELDQEVFPLLEKKYGKMDRQVKNIQKSIMVGAKYGGYGNINPYGAYFDKRN